MNILEKISHSRDTLLTIFENEWDTNISKLSYKEVEQLYNLNTGSDPTINALGVAVGCNFSLSHKYIPSHKLNIIYYNFPEIGRTSSKVTKSIVDKIEKLYSEEIFQNDDSVAIIIDGNISESIDSYIKKLNINFQNNLILSENIQKEIKNSKYNLKKKHFKNVHIYNIDLLVNNLFDHTLVPKHIPIRDINEIQKVLNQFNIDSTQLPIILSTDPISKLLRLVEGDLVKIQRKSIKCGEYLFYRICQD